MGCVYSGRPNWLEMRARPFLTVRYFYERIQRHSLDVNRDVTGMGWKHDTGVFSFGKSCDSLGGGLTSLIRGGG